MNLSMSRRAFVVALSALPFMSRLAGAAVLPPVAPSEHLAALWREAQAALTVAAEARRNSQAAFHAIETAARLSCGPDDDLWAAVQRHPIMQTLRLADDRAARAVEAVFMYPGANAADDEIIMAALSAYEDHDTYWGIREVARAFFTPARYADERHARIDRVLHLEEFEKYDNPPPWWKDLHSRACADPSVCPGFVPWEPQVSTVAEPSQMIVQAQAA